MTEEGIVCDVTTAYEHYQVIDTIYNGRSARILYSDNHYAAQSGLAFDDQDELLFDYIQRFIELVRGVEPKSLLLIGGGTCTLPKAILEDFPDIKMDIVEIDGELLDIATNYFSFLPGLHTKFHALDGREYLDKATEPYDMILIDAFIETSIPKSLQTVEAAAQISRLLNSDGVFAINIISSYYGRRSDVLRREIAALQTHFNNLQIYPASNNISLWSPQNFVLTADNNNLALDDYLRFAGLGLFEVLPNEAIFDQ